ncbi:MAG: hypothetical protein ACI8TQ_001644 [Planctomycetota bacterium]|jgi:hypothetical protein
MNRTENSARQRFWLGGMRGAFVCLLIISCGEDNLETAEKAESPSVSNVDSGDGSPTTANSTASNQSELSSAESSPDLASIYLSDSRIRDLLAGCSSEYYYNRDTSYMVPVLIEKLQKGYTEPLQRSKSELANLGPEAMLAVQRLAETWYTDQAHEAYAQNALDVAVMSDEPIARQIVMRFLQHPRASLRLIALRGMTLRHARPEDFDSLWFQLEGESVGVQEQFLPSLVTADRDRAEDLFLDWFSNESHTFVWQTIGPIIASSKRPETAERCVEIQSRITARFRPFIAACAARTGDGESLRSLDEALRSENRIVRQTAALAAGQAGLLEQLKYSALNDSDSSVRNVAVAGLTALEASPECNQALDACASDPSREVRILALTAMVNRRDSANTERALALLDGDLDATHDGIVVLRERMGVDPKLADRARQHLLVKYESIKHLPLTERFAVIKPLGLIPGAATAEALRKIALANPDVMKGRRTHQMLMVHASNSGKSGRGWLFKQLETESDPLKRIDLLWASTCYRTDAARERLHEFLADPKRSPYEILFASDALARLGPSQDVASLLKRICYRIEQEDVRRGMRCLLWKWY